MIELKAQAYDILAKIEFHQMEIKRLSDELSDVNKKIEAEMATDQKK